jgi:hemoglobin-like flavoprotein
MTTATAIDPSLNATAESLDSDALMLALEAIADHEARFTERFYEIFFERRPDTRVLFGRHSLAEREEMMRETLRSLHALVEQETWLDGNLAALGCSHSEYGVTADMYDAYVEVLVDCSREILGDGLAKASALALEGAITEVSRRMNAGAPSS